MSKLMPSDRLVPQPHPQWPPQVRITYTTPKGEHVEVTEGDWVKLPPTDQPVCKRQGEGDTDE